MIVRKEIGGGKTAEDVYIEGMSIDNLPPYVIYNPSSYKDGPEGFISWCEENVCIPVYPEGSDIALWRPMGELPSEINPETGRSYRDIWEGQKNEVRKCLRMMDGRFIFRLIVFCWPRGDGKSLLAVLVQLWKFFNWTKQQIVLGANSKDQVAFVHFDIMRDIIINSPNLIRLIGRRNILDKKIRLTDEKGNIVSVIRAISSFSGIVSNITGYTFSEIFDMKNPKFFVQLDGSIRNIPNALGVIDSTVSSKQHILYQLFNSFVRRESKTLYFSYRYSKDGNQKDYWNPNMSQRQLDDYRSKFPLGDFERYFLNKWSSGADKIFTDEMIEEWGYIGCDNVIGNHEIMKTLLKKKVDLLENVATLRQQGLHMELVRERVQLYDIEHRLMPIESVYKLHEGPVPCMATRDDLMKLGDLYDTDWAVCGGIDRADPMKGTQRGARTIYTVTAKGLPGSKSKPYLWDVQGAVPNYLYLMLHIVNIESNALEDLKEAIMASMDEYDGMERLCGDRWGIWDLAPWCEEKNIMFEAVFPTYDRQKAAFTELVIASKDGRFKAPPMYVWGSKEIDVIREEARAFIHDPDKHWFGSPEKTEKYGIQDDAIYSLALSMYGGRELTISDFRSRTRQPFFGAFAQNKDLVGNYR